jgi:hypothetical protein
MSSSFARATSLAISGCPLVFCLLRISRASCVSRRVIERVGMGQCSELVRPSMDWICPAGLWHSEAWWIGLDMDLTPHGWIMDRSQDLRYNDNMFLGPSPNGHVTLIYGPLDHPPWTTLDHPKIPLDRHFLDIHPWSSWTDIGRWTNSEHWHGGGVFHSGAFRR